MEQEPSDIKIGIVLFFLHKLILNEKKEKTVLHVEHNIPGIN
jgi:hypothetical protein